ncbi:MAG: hypothetical protein AAGC60_10765 [Acidobacteriota bacterium]
MLIALLFVRSALRRIARLGLGVVRRTLEGARRAAELASVRSRRRWLLVGLPAPLREAALDDVEGQLFAVPEAERQQSLAVVHLLYAEIAAWHRRRSRTPLCVYRLALGAVEQRLIDGGPAAVDDVALDRLDVAARAAAQTLGLRLSNAVDARRARGTSATACRGACRLVAQILDQAIDPSAPAG